MNFTGLSLEQAPPISAPLRFLLSAPIFGILGAVFIFFIDPTTLFSRFSTNSIILTHIFTLGFFTMLMLGALQQMLPVIAGVALPQALNVARSSHLLLSLSILFFIYGFFFSCSTALLIATIGLLLGFLISLSAIIIALFRVEYVTPTIVAIRFSVTFAVISVLMGLHLLSSYMVGNISELHTVFANIHSVLAIFGFTGLLIIGVSFQIFPMFYVTPGFKRFCTTYVAKIISFGLVLWAVLVFLQMDIEIVAKAIIALFFLAFSTAIFKKMIVRRRKVSDVSILYVQSAAIFLATGVISWLLDEFIELDYMFMTAILIGGFLLSIMIAMLYKIVPFLVWFHLNGAGYMNILTMKEIINAKVAKVQFALFVGAIVLLIFSMYLPLLIEIAAIMLIISFALLEYNLIKAVLYYREIKKKPSDMELMMAGVETSEK
ncbi:MAG: hypothetical protein GQ570_00075 [Helicobacteraceae bacterium]|nr:hypothetical protein [Helicobacteraceae bacterium]